MIKEISIRAFANNTCSTKDIQIPLSMITTEEIFVVNSVTIQNKYVDNKRTDEVEAIIYDLVEPKTFVPIRVKVLAKTPVISSTDIETSDVPIFIQLSLEETVIKPYRIEYAKVSISIVTPYVTVAKQEK